MIFNICSLTPYSDVPFYYYIGGIFENYYVNIYLKENGADQRFYVHPTHYDMDIDIDTRTNQMNLIREHLDIHLDSILESHRGFTSLSPLNLI